MINKITITMPYYDAPEMLREHLKYWQAYSDEVKENVRVVLVDDGSPTSPAIDVLKDADLPGFPIELYRVLENIPWNHGGARNLCMDRVTDEGWILTTDIDLVLGIESIEKLMQLELDPAKVYMPNRLDPQGDEWVVMKRHPESYVMTREMFWKIGGFDEDFTGYWNGVFNPFRFALKRTAERVMFDDIYLKNYSGTIEGAMVTEWGRRGSEYDIHNNRDLCLKRRFIKNNYNPKNPLRFNWEREL